MEMNKAIKVGLLGLGTVGSGVFKTLYGNDTIEIKSIAVKNISKKRNIEGLSNNILTDNPRQIVEDPEIQIVVEIMGGINPAYDLIKTAILNKKHIVTANKELIAKYGEELFELAKDNNVVILYEAAVAGGIPIIMPVKTGLAGNKFKKIAGILNGTTNFILSKMEKEGAEFETVLKEAQELGYAEADPTGDVQGFDAAYKIAILASIAFNKRIDMAQVYREGIDKITPLDTQYAKEFDYKIKLIALAQENEENKIDIRVHPFFVSTKHPLAHIDDVLNAVFLQGEPVGKVMFSGPGAGEFPTASSVVGDIISLAQEIPFTDYPLPMLRCRHEENAGYVKISETQNKYYISVKAQNNPGVIGELGVICGSNGLNLSSIVQKGLLEDGSAHVVMLTELSNEKNMTNAVEKMNKSPNITRVLNVIRIMD